MSSQLNTIIKELGAGLILRRSSPEDADALMAFCGHIHSDGADRCDALIAAWTRDLLTRPHPRFHSDDFTVVEDLATGRIVSTLNLIDQTWTYDGIPFEVGRPELVGTLPEYRNRGLVRIQFDEIHRWSQQRGQMVQAITGIPYYYRLFGYEMALDLDGWAGGYELNIPRLPEGEHEPCSFRPATESDLPFIAAVYREGCTRYPIACVRDEAAWRYELRGRHPLALQPLLIIESPDGSAIGFIRHHPTLGRRGLTVSLYELRPGISWLDITPAVMRYAWKTGQEYGRRAGTPCHGFTFALGEAHPVYDLFRERLPEKPQSYAWYMRVSDIPAFLKHIAPALEARLAASAACGYTGMKHVSFYRTGLELSFERGRLASIEPWQPGPREQEGDIAFPGLTFLQLLFGYRSLEQLRTSFADCWWNSNETRALFEALFPRKSSQVIGLS
jgi:hypothetical protein